MTGDDTGGDRDPDRVWVFDSKTVWALVERDEDGVPLLVIGDGDCSVKLAASRQTAETMLAVRRITDQIWLFLRVVDDSAPLLLGPGQPNGAAGPAAGVRIAEPGNSGPGG